MLDKAPSWLIWTTLLYVGLPFMLYWAVPYLFYHNKTKSKRIAIYVLGDLGHSPRICYHARSFSAAGWEVELCGYMEEQPPKDLLEDPRVTIRVLPQVAAASAGKSLGQTVRKVVFQTWHIVRQLWELRGCDYILLQNPPSIPILPIAAIFKLLTRSRLIVDWHNLAYSVLQLRVGSFFHPLVLGSYAVEFLFSRMADYHITVTVAMKDYLAKRFLLPAQRIAVMYDRPGEQFRPLPAGEREAALAEPFIKDYIPAGFDVQRGDTILVTSTSFTPDEDINVLFGALKIYESAAAKFDATLPRILLFITGKGPLKNKYMEEVRNYEWKRCTIHFLWLSAEDYPRLLQLCDFGVSLHTSTSGLDLPMKVLDMFGSGLPAFVMNYPAIDELVQSHVNGLKFKTRRELEQYLVFAIKDEHTRKVLKEGALLESKNRWQQSWLSAMRELQIVR
ncbi:AaceriADL338Cp [[Ashbya] aceris (nom. inval.)]|nr:AaceriADL338Cp [[Ashbya] aceris (nom. inval.)]